MKHSKRFLALAAILSILVTGCDAMSGVFSSKLDTSKVANPVQGKVLGLDGKPAANVAVSALISNNAAGLISNNAAGLIGNNSAALVGNNSAMYRTQASSQLQTRTDSNGNFVLGSSDNETLNIEAVLSDDAKALMMNVKGNSGEISLRLQPTGKISGKVTSAFASLTNLLGTDVFVPGTSYQAKTDKNGAYTIDYVPVGTFELVAILGRDVYGFTTGVKVAANATTTAPDVAMGVDNPKITAVEPLAAGPGATVTITGSGFGVSKDLRPQVMIEGNKAEIVSAADGRIEAKLPAGAVSGRLYVTVQELPSNPVAFQVIKSIALYPSYLDKTKDAAPALDTLAVNKTRSYSYRALDTANALVTATPSITWSTSDSALATVNGGTLNAIAAGAVKLVASSGTVKAELPLTLVAGVSSFTIVPSQMNTLTSYPVGADNVDTTKSSIQLGTMARYLGAESDVQTPGLWSTTDTRITLTADGKVTVKAGAESGPATVTATSVADPSKTAQVIIPIARQGSLTVGIQ